MSIVTSLADNGVGSLRAAIASATPGETITFDASLAGQTISLNSPLEINQNITLDGSAATGLILNGNDSTRIITVDGIGVQVSIKDLIFRNGRAVQDDGAGGAIKTNNQTQLTVENSQFFDNVSTGEGGGAIWTGYQSTTTVLNSTFEGNEALDLNTERGGGAIAGKSEGDLTVRDSVFNNNAGTTGGGINSLLGNLTVENSTFTNNRSTGGNSTLRVGGNGGAIFTDGASATIDASTEGNITIRNSRFDSNSGFGAGGGLFLFAYDGDAVTVENSTVVNNRVELHSNFSDAFGGGFRFGGGGTLNMSNTTIFKNFAALQGGGFWSGENSPVTIFNSVFCDNEAISGTVDPGLGGGVVITGNPVATITQSTIAGNVASFRGGGFWGGGTNLTLTDSLVANNTIQDSANVNHHTGNTFTDGGGNFQSLQPKADDTKVTAGVTLLDPQLGTCIDNGTAIQTPPIPGNPLVTGGAEAVTTPGTIPNAPSDLVTTVTNNQIQVTWQDNSDNETEFVLERSTDQNNWTVIANLSANTTEYIDKTITANTPYFYRLKAINGLGESGFTNIAETALNGQNIPTQTTNQPPTLTPTQPGIFDLGGTSDLVNLQVTLKSSLTSFVHELGAYVVEDDQGRVNGLTPQDNGYFEAALQNSQVIFSVLPQGTFPQFTYSRQLQFTGGQKLGFYLLRDRTTEQVLKDRDFSRVLYSTQAVQVEQFGEIFALSWEDGLGNRDFQDLQVEINLNASNIPLTTTWQGEQQGELIDLSGFTGTIAANIQVASSANYNNSYGFYIVDDPLTGQINGLLPGDVNYAQTAVQNQINLSEGLPGGQVIAPFLIANGTTADFLNQNPENSSGGNIIAYFPYLGANPDGEDHVRLLGDNTFGFEDLLGGGDRDYNDWVVQVTVNH